MPMLHDGPPPIPADMVRDFRTQLAPTYGHQLVNHDGRYVLVVRVPGDRPDPHGRDIKACADVLSEEHVANTTHILLIGDEKVLRVDPIPVRDAIREKLRDDTPTSKEVRRQVERDFGARLLQPASKREVCLAVRVPKDSYKSLTNDDLVRIQQAVGPALGNQAANVGMCYLVADNDYRRCTADEFARVLRGESPLKPAKANNYVTAGDTKAARALAGTSSFSGSAFGQLISNAVTMDAKMQANKQARKGGAQTEATPPAAAPAPAPAPPTPAPPAQSLAPGLVGFATAPTPAPVAAPAPSLFAPPAPTPALSLFAPPAQPTTPTAPPYEEPASPDPLTALSTGFHELGYEVMTDVAALGISLAAHQPGGKRIVVLCTPVASPEAVQGFTKLVTELEADAGLLVADEVPAGTWLATAGTKVEVLRSDALTTL